ncbi:hypothetical protein SAMN02745216_01146 [Desulfatibacillum alkenivorans DSM 16219]|jgi:hypothetical protein|uniref:Uncharacterized protein n=1 Tax=Desulfatibacillum alkenivorans DSM 16219 TaxID=1121393 RepID=A0A1M6GYP8_9BACT|nr:hypothetical protein [Desulfatibacillum alkenivorans]SHJ15052.1 hypothetical protein SAMN02745216_01146 [Desulfatibacillum alkenivorans DSM 16219]
MGHKTRKKNYERTIAVAAACWSSVNIVLIYLFEKSYLGPTPLYLPSILAVISLAGVVSCMVVTCFLKPKSKLVFSSCAFFAAALLAQLKAMLELLYVS